MQAEASSKGGSREGPSKWGTAEASELHPGDSGLAQVSLLFLKKDQPFRTSLRVTEKAFLTKNAFDKETQFGFILSNARTFNTFLMLELMQSLRFYVAHANAGTRNASDSPLVSELFRSPESQTAAVAAVVAEREDRLLHLLRSYGCAVVLANLIITFIFSS